MKASHPRKTYAFETVAAATSFLLAFVMEAKQREQV